MRPINIVTFALTVTIAAGLTGSHYTAEAQRARKSSNPGKVRKAAAPFIHRDDESQPGRGRKPARRPQDPRLVDVFKDFDAWWNDNRDGATLAALGKVPGIDHFVHPVTELADGIDPNSDVVLITSNSWGDRATSAAQNHPAAQANLSSFVRNGGVAVIDMGDNDYDGGFMAPGAVGTPALVFPSNEADATLTAAAAGEDGLLGTVDDHRLTRGADGVAGTPDDLTQTNIDACCYVAHGNLEDGIVLPPDATVLMTASFAGVQKPILAEYCVGYGRVIVDTVTKEFEGHDPVGHGPSRFMMALLAYAMDAKAQTACQINGLIESVHAMRPDKAGAALEAKLRMARADLERGKDSAAIGHLVAFTNMARSRRAPALAAPLAAEWVGIATKIMSAVAE